MREGKRKENKQTNIQQKEESNVFCKLKSLVCYFIGPRTFAMAVKSHYSEGEQKHMHDSDFYCPPPHHLKSKQNRLLIAAFELTLKLGNFFLEKI